MWYILLCISKNILTFAAVLLTLNTTLMMYKVSYEDRAGQVFSFITFNPEMHCLARELERCCIKSFTISLAGSEQKGGQYEQQPE